MKRALAKRLAAVEGFADPDPELEQYPIPADLAAHVLHLADLHGDLAGRSVADLGAGTGMLALAAATRSPARVLAVELDAEALRVARENERRVDPGTNVDWLRGDATRPPLSAVDTVVSNPPFGAQRGNEHADRAFLETAADLAGVSYTVHNAGSKGFVESFASDRGGEVTHAFAADFPVSAQFDFHTSDREVLDVEVFRIEW
ncbi:METTL5 family protein [Halobacterium jilantaiense]|uniref:Methyltransferase-like protein 5 n=1 Tax=Halobacterium jilantaiense TaxID=355548 RepID=A0A1I0N1S0_9EURY|nr:METTL5 family protein [Halobacterium jilantaiense]SEV94765.1 methyltransferase [Halobacterium jilantaiense]